MIALALAAAVYFGWSRRAARADRGDRTVARLRDLAADDNGNAMTPAISPDGNYVVYVQRDGEVQPLGPTGGANSNVQRRAGRVRRRAFRAHGHARRQLRGLPSRQHGTGAAGVPELWRVPFLGGSTEEAPLENVWSAIGWSPDGRQMAFVRVDAAGNATRWSSPTPTAAANAC